MTDDPRAKAEDCRPLFELMNRIRDLAPWNWMEESEIFGVQDPDTGEIGFVSVMGMAGDHYSIAVYQGALGLYRFQNLQQKAPFIRPEDLFNTPHLQASFEDRDTLQKYDYNLIKSLGLKYRGRNAWPMFYSYRPGYAPWQIEPQEARFLGHALGQLLEVAPRVKKDSEYLIPEGENDYLVRVARKEGADWVWEDTVMTIDRPGPKPIAVEVDPDVLESIKRMPRKNYKVEADFFMLPTTIGDRNERPYFPYLLLMVDTNSSMILCTEFLMPDPSMEAMQGQLAMTALRAVARLGEVPSEIAVRGDPLYGMLAAFSRESELNITQSHQLPTLDEAIDHLQNFLMR